MSKYDPQPVTLALIRKLASGQNPDRPREVRDSKNHLILRHQPSGYLSLYVELGRGKRKRLCNARHIIDKNSPITLGRVKNQASVICGESAGGRDFKVERDKARSIPTLGQFIDEHYSERGSTATLERLKTTFAEFYDYKLSELTPANLERWRRARRKHRMKNGKRLAGESINRDLAALGGVLTYARELEVIDVHPMAGIRRERVDRNKVTRRALTVDEKRRLLAALDARDQEKRAARASGNQWREERGYARNPNVGRYFDVLTPAVIVSLETGLRRGELFDLKWPAVKFDDRSLYVAGETSKTNLTRDIPLNDAAYRTLRDWWLQQGQPKDGYVFPGKYGGRLDNLKKSFYAVLKRAEIERVDPLGHSVTWHSLRHTFGTLLCAQCADLRTVKELMGHASIVTTQRYLHTDKERMAEAVALLVNSS